MVRTESLLLESLRPPPRCQESDPDTVAAPTAQRQRVCEISGQSSHSQSTTEALSGGPGTCLAQRPNTCGEDMLHGENDHAASPLARHHELGQSTQWRITSPRLLIVSAQHVPTVPPGPLRRIPDPRGPIQLAERGSGRAEGSQGHKSTWAGGRAQKSNQRVRIWIVDIVNARSKCGMLPCS